ncbi:MAG: SMI1/KNR4 family protein [Clostridia bacterium]|nr:SMI1/KNR4 family protein [Clostridia bacterium]
MIKKQLVVLDSYLRKQRSDFYSNLNPPLEDGQIEALEAKFGITVPEDLKILYQWKNGQNSECYESFVNNSVFMTLEEALGTAQEMTSMIGSDFDVDNWWSQYWIPIFHNGGGDHICYDIGGVFTGKKGQVIEFWHADNDRNVIAPNLQSFIESVNQFYETTPVQDFDEFFTVKDIQGFPKVFYVK